MQPNDPRGRRNLPRRGRRIRRSRDEGHPIRGRPSTEAWQPRRHEPDVPDEQLTERQLQWAYLR